MVLGTVVAWPRCSDLQVLGLGDGIVVWMIFAWIDVWFKEWICTWVWESMVGTDCYWINRHKTGSNVFRGRNCNLCAARYWKVEIDTVWEFPHAWDGFERLKGRKRVNSVELWSCNKNDKIDYKSSNVINICGLEILLDSFVHSFLHI